ncbi:hypothetical protein D3C71_1438640 [compost metagenome]
MRVAYRVALRGACAPDRIMMPACIGCYLQQLPSRFGDKHRSGRQVQIMLAGNGPDGAVMVARIFRRIEQRIYGLIAFHIDDAQHLAREQVMNPSFPGRDDSVIDRLGCRLLAHYRLKCTHVSSLLSSMRRHSMYFQKPAGSPRSG